MLFRRAPAVTAFGSARWMPRQAVHRMTEGSGLVIGREDRNGGALLRYAGPAHLITIAPTGKGVGTIIPNLLTAARSMLVMDPKGENAAVARRARSRFGPVHVLDPFEVTGLPPASCNPLDRIALARSAPMLAWCRRRAAHPRMQAALPRRSRVPGTVRRRREIRRARRRMMM
jgi:type IV secretory pathway TraG/TraD family ATPase VirD4